MSAWGLGLRKPRIHLSLALVPILLVILGFVAAGYVWVHAIGALKSSEPVPVTARAEAVVWGDRVFPNRRRFSIWLNARGISYAGWAAKHPSGVRILEPARAQALARARASKIAAPPRGRTPPAARVVVPKQATGARATGAATPIAGSAWPDLRPFAFLLAGLLGILSLLPRSVAWKLTGHRVELIREGRYYLFASALSLGLGLLVVSIAG